jgi:flap endonuclease-1
MGIKNFFKFIEKYSPESIKNTKIIDYKNKVIGIDANLMLYKIIFAIRANGYDLKNNNIIITHVHTLLLKLLAFKKYNIKPIFVYDNAPPELKYNTLEERDELKKKIINKYKDDTTDKGKRIYYYVKSNITEKEIEECKLLIDIFGFVNIQAEQEADAQLADMYKSGLIDVIISDDMDILLFGGGTLVKNFSISEKETMKEIDLEIILKTLKLSKKMLIDLGILMGSDYCDNNGMSYNKAYKLIKKYDSLKKIPKDVFNYDCSGAQEYFKEPLVLHIEEVMSNEKINKKKLKNYLLKFNFGDNYIDKLMEKINLMEK